MGKRTYREMQVEGQAEAQAERDHLETPKDERARREHERALAWGARELPNEDPGFAATAAQMIKSSGQRVTPAAVLARLEAEGRDAASSAATYARHPGLFGDEA